MTKNVYLLGMFIAGLIMAFIGGYKMATSIEAPGCVKTPRWAEIVFAVGMIGIVFSVGISVLS